MPFPQDFRDGPDDRNVGRSAKDVEAVDRRFPIGGRATLSPTLNPQAADDEKGRRRRCRTPCRPETGRVCPAAEA
jgi:hypothetical protein